MTIATQTDQIFKHLSQGHRLTPLEALDRFGCFRLGARIYDLKKQGYDIKRRMVETAEGARVAEYWM